MKNKLEPSLRINRRHLLLNINNKKDVEKILIDYLGILGVAKANIIFLEQEGKLILSINRKELNNIRAAIEISNKNIKILKVSGTLKGLN